MEADYERVILARRKRQVVEEKKRKRATELLETSKNLTLDTAAIESLTVPQLDQQLDYHRDQAPDTIDFLHKIPVSATNLSP